MGADANSQVYEDQILLIKGAEAELVEKKSRFIATVRGRGSSFCGRDEEEVL